MKIGILTFHFGVNYGAVLQCYALQEYLEEQNHSVRIINFNPTVKKGKKISNSKRIKRIVKLSIRLVQRLITHPLLYYYGKIQKLNFVHFREANLNLTKAYNLDTLKKISEEFDAIIVGSDQVWNKSQQEHGAYFLTPFTSFKGLRISYAPCCPLDIIENKDSNFLKKSLLKFDRISVRDYQTFHFVKKLTNIEPYLVEDPVLLFDFNKKIKNLNHIKKPYILVYILGSEIDGGHKNTITRIREKNKDLPVYAIILTENKPKIFDWVDKNFWHVTVEEWLSMFFHSRFIYTDSFHGVLFALKFKKKFLAYYKDETRSSRLIDLIKRYKLENNIVNSYYKAVEKNAFNGNVDYEKLQSILLNNINESKRFLKEALI